MISAMYEHSYSTNAAVLIFASLLLTLVSFVIRFLIQRPKASTLPPGPKGWPLIGNVHQLPMTYQEKAFAQWGRQFGPIVHAKLFRKNAIILNTAEAARDLMEKRSGNYSDRPNFILLNDLMGWENAVTQMRYGNRHRLHRKWIQDAIQTKEALESYHDIQLRERNIVLAELLSTPEAFVNHLTRFSAAIILEITYGHRVTSNEDPFIAITEEAGTATVRAGSPGSMLVDFFPILKHYPTWLPGSSWKVDALNVRVLVQRVMDVPHNMVKGKMAAGNARPSFTSKLLEECYRNGGLTPQDEVDIKGVASVLYAAGTETTTTVLLTFLFAMVLYPEVFKKAQAEVDNVVGKDKLPDHHDYASLPYLQCVIKEAYRWHVPVPLAVPHSSMKDDEYRGYHIPAESMVIPNIWGMSQDEQQYPNPEKFYPERFMNLDRAKNELLDPRNLVFGFGRRLCPGREFADMNIFLMASAIIATMDIAKALDENGQEITPREEFTSGFVSRPKDFRCRFIPRSKMAIKLIEQMNVSN